MKLLNNLKYTLIAFILVPASLGIGLLFPAYAGAASSCSSTNSSCDACGALSQLNSNQDCNHGSTNVNGLLSTIVQIISFIAGAIAVIMIVLAGLKFITSGGDSTRVSSARG